MLRSLAASLVALGLAQSAAAITITESASVDFGDAFADRTQAPPATDRIQGGVGFVIGSSDPLDYIALTDLVPGATFTLFAQTFVSENVGLSVLDEAEALLVAEVVFTETTFPTLTGTVPTSGTIVLRLRSVTSDGDFLTGWQVDVQAPRVVPEPATALLFAFGLATVGALRRLS
jgi:hypothetical protein